LTSPVNFALTTVTAIRSPAAPGARRAQHDDPWRKGVVELKRRRILGITATQAPLAVKGHESLRAGHPHKD